MHRLLWRTAVGLCDIALEDHWGLKIPLCRNDTDVSENIRKRFFTENVCRQFFQGGRPVFRLTLDAGELLLPPRRGAVTGHFKQPTGLSEVLGNGHGLCGMKRTSDPALLIVNLETGGNAYRG